MSESLLTPNRERSLRIKFSDILMIICPEKFGRSFCIILSIISGITKKHLTGNSPNPGDKSPLVSSGKLSHNYGKSPFLMGKLTISMAIFTSYVSHYQRVPSIRSENPPRLQPQKRCPNWALYALHSFPRPGQRHDALFPDLFHGDSAET